MIVNIVMTIAFSAAFITAGYRIRDLRVRRHDPALRALVTALLCLGVGIAVITPMLYPLLNAAVGVPNLFRLIGHLAYIGFAAAFALMRLHVAYEPEQAAPRARRRVIGYLIASAAMVALFVAAPVDEDRVDWTIYYGEEPMVVAYLMVYMLTFGSALWEVARLSYRLATFVPGRLERVGLRITGAGAVLGLSYTIYKALYLAAQAADLQPPASLTWIYREDIISPLLAAPGALLIIIGLTLPSWIPPLHAGASTVAAYRHYRRLYPLWLDLYTAQPDILLEAEPPAWPAPTRVRRLLARRAIEIPDGILRLGDYYDPAVQEAAEKAGRARGLTGDALRAAITAACLRDALAAHAADRRPASPAVIEPADAATLADQIAWLRRLAVEYKKAPGTWAATSAGRVTTA